jgi:hypothetical protein
MGNLFIEGKFTASLSRHNSERDTRHNQLWLDFITSIQHLASNPKYKEILLSIDADKEP